MPALGVSDTGGMRSKRDGGTGYRSFGRSAVVDLFALALLVAAALPAVWPLLRARDLQTFGGDWPAHAFRIAEIQRYGIASWSHAWAGGMPFWSGYQAAPHLLAAALIWLMGIGTTRAMVVLAGVLLLGLRLIGYAALRWAGARPASALTGVAVATLLDTARQPLANYSELWGLALAPLALLGGYRWAARPSGCVVAALLGLAVEIHPLLAVTGGIALGAGALARPGGCSWRMLIGQFSLLLLGAAVFWLPLIGSARPAYSEPYYTSVQFARLLYRLAVAGFLPSWPVVMALTLAGALAAWRRDRLASAPRFLLLVAGASGLLVTASLSDAAPEGLRQAQLARLASLWPLLSGAGAALLLNGLATLHPARTATAAPDPSVAALRTAALSRARFPTRLAWSLAFVTVIAAATRGRGGALPVLVRPSDDGMAITNLLTSESDRRVWTNAVLTARLSLVSGGALRFAGSYSGREWSILHGPLEFYLAGNGAPRERSAYLIAAGVQFVAVPAGVWPELGDLARAADAPTWQAIGNAEGYDLFRLSFTSPAAWTLPRARRDGLTAPNARFRDVASSYLRDQAVERFAVAAQAEESRPAVVRYPGPASIEVDLAALDGDRYLVVNESWDNAWRARMDGQPLPLARFGPNLIGVDLAGVQGDATVRLFHHWRAVERVGLLLSLLSTPFSGLLSLGLSRRRRSDAAHGVDGTAQHTGADAAC